MDMRNYTTKGGKVLTLTQAEIDAIVEDTLAAAEVARGLRAEAERLDSLLTRWENVGKQDRAKEAVATHEEWIAQKTTGESVMKDMERILADAEPEWGQFVIAHTQYASQRGHWVRYGRNMMGGYNWANGETVARWRDLIEPVLVPSQETFAVLERAERAEEENRRLFHLESDLVNAKSVAKSYKNRYETAKQMLEAEATNAAAWKKRALGRDKPLVSDGP